MTPLWTTTCDIYRPFGDSTPTATGVACRLVPDLPRGQLAAGLSWTHYVDCSVDTDVRDGCTRSEGSASVTFADGDEVRVPSVSDVRYVVVWVETHNLDGPNSFRRAFLTRHDAAWPGR